MTGGRATSRRVRRKLAKRTQVQGWLTVRDVDVPYRLDRLIQRVRRRGEGVIIVGIDGRPRAVLIAPWHDGAPTSRLSASAPAHPRRAPRGTRHGRAARSRQPRPEND